MKQLKMPSAYTILMVLILVVAALTWVLPAGQYQYLGSGEPITGSYTQVARNGQSLIDVVRAPLNGFYEAIEIAVFILTVGGFLGVMGKTGAVFRTDVWEKNPAAARCQGEFPRLKAPTTNNY